MIPYEIDPTLHTAEPEALVLDDGFSPAPQHSEPSGSKTTPAPVDTQVEPVLGR
jgi:hypothetical protein